MVLIKVKNDVNNHNPIRTDNNLRVVYTRKLCKLIADDTDKKIEKKIEAITKMANNNTKKENDIEHEFNKCKYKSKYFAISEREPEYKQENKSIIIPKKVTLLENDGEYEPEEITKKRRDLYEEIIEHEFHMEIAEAVKQNPKKNFGSRTKKYSSKEKTTW
jgi:hypothetical protein